MKEKFIAVLGVCAVLGAAGGAVGFSLWSDSEAAQDKQALKQELREWRQALRQWNKRQPLYLETRQDVARLASAVRRRAIYDALEPSDDLSQGVALVAGDLPGDVDQLQATLVQIDGPCDVWSGSCEEPQPELWPNARTLLETVKEDVKRLDPGPRPPRPE